MAAEASSMSRRAVLGAIAVGSGVGAALLTSSSGPAAPAALAPSDREVTVSHWLVTRRRPYFIGHRGSGDVFPEHSMEAYEGAVGWGAPCVEVSVNMTSDKVLICMHDGTYDRTTIGTGKIALQPSTVLRSTYLSQSQLGPAWAEAPRPRVPLFDQVLRVFGGRTVLIVEAKNDAAYPSMKSMIEVRGLAQSVILKLDHTSRRFAEAAAAGYSLFGYIGSDTELTIANIRALADKLNKNRDCLVVPAYSKNGYVDDSLVVYAVSTGIPVWVFPVHRRVDVTHFLALGVSGFVTSSYFYVSTNAPSAIADTWKSVAIAPGEITRDPSSPSYAPKWSQDGTGVLTLRAQNKQHFLTLGQLGPLKNAKTTYSIEFEASWAVLPADLASNLTLCFGHVDDAYYEHRSGLGTGYHAIIRADGRLALFLHRDRTVDGVSLGETKGVPAAAGNWMRFKLQVSPSMITWSRLDGTGSSVTARQSEVRGGYLHIGRSSTDGSGAFRNFWIS